MYCIPRHIIHLTTQEPKTQEALNNQWYIDTDIHRHIFTYKQQNMKHTTKQPMQQRTRMLAPVYVGVVLILLTLKVLYHEWTRSTCVDWNVLLVESTQEQQTDGDITYNHPNDPLLNRVSLPT